MDHLHASFLETLTSRRERTSTTASMLSAFAAPARPGPVSASAARSAHARHGLLRWMSGWNQAWEIGRYAWPNSRRRMQRRYVAREDWMVRSDAGERSVGLKNVSFLKRMKTYFSRLKAYCTDTDQSYCNIISRDKV
jgi:hypothetical protein